MKKIIFWLMGPSRRLILELFIAHAKAHLAGSALLVGLHREFIIASDLPEASKNKLRQDAAVLAARNAILATSISKLEKLLGRNHADENFNPTNPA